MATTEQLNARLRPLVAGYYETGDETLLGQVLEALRPVLLRYARYPLGVHDSERAEDLTHDALLAVLLSLRARRFTLGEGSVVGYARVVCRHKHAQGLRRHWDQPGTAEDPYLLLGTAAAEPPADLPAGTEYEAEAGAAVTAVTSAVLGLDPHARAAVVLHYYQGLPASEAAARLGLDEHQYQSRLHRGMSELRTWGEQQLPPTAEAYASLPSLDTGDLFTEPLRLAG